MTFFFIESISIMVDSCWPGHLYFIPKCLYGICAYYLNIILIRESQASSLSCYLTGGIWHGLRNYEWKGEQVF